MSFNGGQGSRWTELAARFDGRTVDEGIERDSPTSNRRRDLYVPPTDLRARRMPDHSGAPRRTPFAELHCHSYFSFLDGVSSPEELVEEAARLELDALALTDTDGLYGAVRFAQAARELGVRTVYGAELSLDLPRQQTGVAYPEGEHLLVLARGPEGYRRLCRVISAAHLRADAEKGLPQYDRAEVVRELAGHVKVLTGGDHGAVRRAYLTGGLPAADRELRKLIGQFGREHVVVELIAYGEPLDDVHNGDLAELAKRHGLTVIASKGVRYHSPRRGRALAPAVAALRARRTVDEMEGWLRAGDDAFLRSGAEMADIFTRYEGAVQNAALLGVECAFDLSLVAPRLPPFPVKDGHTEDSYLRELTWQGAARHYGPRAGNEEAYRQLEHELEIISDLGFPGYFLVVWDIVRFCGENDILCQGRGSAANSAVCYALGITKADPVRWGLLFERFLAPERDGPPDIDIDIESDRREEVIQYVYERHGRHRAALVANVITYRNRSAVRDAARALGYSPGQIDRWAKTLDAWGTLASARADPEQDIPADVLDLASGLEGAPRHLGIHPGGMVITDQPVSEVVPVENARMADRTVLQWDKDDCAEIGLVKFDLLGLGMLSAIHYTIDLVAEHEDTVVDLAHLDLADPKVYEMLCAADAIGVFQVESRAQLATLPRLRPREFYDLVVEVALIRPGPIQGGSVHPYIRRRNGGEWEHAHPLLANSLDRTLGVPLFQEQVMQMAVDVASFTAAEADQLRRAMGAKRSHRKMAQLRQRFYDGAAANGITGALADQIFTQVEAFAGYGFPEAHSMSFAHLVYASAYLKLYHPAAFCAGLLRAQPMGFYSAQSLTADARRHGVLIHHPDIVRSLAHTTTEPDPASRGGVAVRLGLGEIRGLGEEVAQRIVDERANGPFTGIDDLARRTNLTTAHLENLATSGALRPLEPSRRRALWTAGAAARDKPDLLPGTTTPTPPPALPGMTALELLTADVHTTGLSADQHPVDLLRARLDDRGAYTVARLSTVLNGTRILVGGVVTHRQRPPTAGGVTFLSLEDETGIVNVTVSRGMDRRYRTLIRTSTALLVRGLLESQSGALNVIADHLEPLDARGTAPSRDYR
ncbi:error-prone DNA polymerase [Amycolatopsis magusensis]|uniref:error-prone DNA polymerase n=1 Tax=Amycolatopsis magusensis TaxID=882444 RepID=UPI003F685768